MQVPPLMNPGAAAPHVEECVGKPAGVAQAAGDTGDRIDLHTETGVGETCRIRVPTIDVGCGKAALNADHPSPWAANAFTQRELVVAADLTAEQSPARIDPTRAEYGVPHPVG